MIGVISILCLFFIGIPICIWFDFKEEEKTKIKNESDAKWWLSKELEKPPYRVVVLTKNSDVYRSKYFKPRYSIERWLCWTHFTYTSKQLAEEKIAQSFSSGRYFHEKTNTYIPMCDIEKIKVVRAKA